MDPDPDSDPAIFVIDLQDANKKIILKKFNNFQRLVIKKLQNIRNQGLLFLLVIEGSGSIPLTNGTGSATLIARKYAQARKVQYSLKVTATHWSPLLVFVHF
jgi:hypothetical protein